MKNCPLPFAVTKQRTTTVYCVLSDWEVFLAVGKGLLALSAEIFILGIAIRENITLDNLSVA
ncbi:MAG: hypothetical protein ACYDER_25610 [Ktedonobacteraceae bacterium]